MSGPRGEGGVLQLVLGGEGGSYEWSQVFSFLLEWS